MPNLLDKLLEDANLNYEDLNHEERETYKKQTFDLKVLSVTDVIEHVRNMKNSVALQLTDIPDDDSHRDINCKLKARLKNYLVQEAFLTSPEKAEKAMRDALQTLKGKKV